MFNSFTTHSISVKTYQVRRINESTYLVTSLPEFENENHKRFSNDKSSNKVVPLNDYKRYTGYYESTMSGVRSSVTVGEKRDKVKNGTVSAKFIKAVRERYFRTYYTTNKKSTISLLPEKISPFLAEISNDGAGVTVKLKQNLFKARKIASVVINQFQSRVKRRKVFFDEVKRRKRNKLHRTGRPGHFLSGLTWKHFHSRHSRNLPLII